MSPNLDDELKEEIKKGAKLSPVDENEKKKMEEDKKKRLEELKKVKDALEKKGTE